MNGNGQGDWIVQIHCEGRLWVANIYRGDDYDHLVTCIRGEGYSHFLAEFDRIMYKENRDAHTVKKHE